eukprot:COSAG04_NODE_18805_length_432_cov_0.774775_1_plen_59_part_10
MNVAMSSECHVSVFIGAARPFALLPKAADAAPNQVNEVVLFAVEVHESRLLGRALGLLR